MAAQPAIVLDRHYILYDDGTVHRVDGSILDPVHNLPFPFVDIVDLVAKLLEDNYSWYGGGPSTNVNVDTLMQYTVFIRAAGDAISWNNPGFWIANRPGQFYVNAQVAYYPGNPNVNVGLDLLTTGATILPGMTMQGLSYDALGAETRFTRTETVVDLSPGDQLYANTVRLGNASSSLSDPENSFLFVEFTAADDIPGTDPFILDYNDRILTVSDGRIYRWNAPIVPSSEALTSAYAPYWELIYP